MWRFAVQRLSTRTANLVAFTLECLSSALTSLSAKKPTESKHMSLVKECKCWNKALRLWCYLTFWPTLCFHCYTVVSICVPYFWIGSMAKTFVRLLFSMEMWNPHLKHLICTPFCRTTQRNTPPTGRTNTCQLQARLLCALLPHVGPKLKLAELQATHNFKVV